MQAVFDQGTWSNLDRSAYRNRTGGYRTHACRLEPEAILSGPRAAMKCRSPDNPDFGDFGDFICHRNDLEYPASRGTHG